MNTNETFKRPVKYAFRMWWKHDVVDRVLGKAQFLTSDDYRYYRWSKKKVWARFIADHPNLECSIDRPGWIYKAS